MRKIFTLLILLLLLPVTALAADMNTVYVGGVELAGSSTSIAYATTNENGEVITEGATADNYNIMWDGSTLTLKNAYITNAAHEDNYRHPVEGAAIGVANSSGAAELTIELESDNTIEDVSLGIWVYSSTTGYASLTIMGNGSLTASVSANSGILVQSNDGNATLSIENAEVTTTSSSSDGVLVQAKDGSNASLTVNGGSLTATGKSEDGAGIRYTFGGAISGSGKPSLTVSNSAIVRANGSAGGITSNSSSPIQYETGSDSTGGIVFDNGTGTVYGDVELQEDLEIGEGESLTLDDGASLNTGDYTLTVDGGTLTGNVTGKVTYKVTGVSLSKASLTLDVGGTEDLIATITPETATDKNLTWASDANGVATVDQNGKVNAVAPGTANITVTTQDGSHTATCAVTVTQPVTGVTLDPTSLSLFTGDTATLTATVEPENATNKNVTWSSDKPEVATVENGKVTAVKEGTATITVTAQDGSGVSTSCSVTVTHSMVHTPKKDATCTEDGNIEYWYCKNCDMYFSDENATEELSDVVIPATGHHYVNGYCTKCGHRDPDYRPDPISYYNIYIEDVCDGVEVTTSKNVVREGGSVSVYVKKDTVNYTFDNFKVYYKRSYYGTWDELKEGTQPGEYPIKNIWTHIYIKAEGAEEKEDPTGIESIEGVKVYTKDGSLYVQTPQREQVIIVSMSGAVVKNEEQVGLKQYHGLQPGIYIVRVGDRAYKLRLN